MQLLPGGAGDELVAAGAAHVRARRSWGGSWPSWSLDSSRPRAIVASALSCSPGELGVLWPLPVVRRFGGRLFAARGAQFLALDHAAGGVQPAEADGAAVERRRRQVGHLLDVREASSRPGWSAATRPEPGRADRAVVRFPGRQLFDGQMRISMCAVSAVALISPLKVAERSVWGVVGGGALLERGRGERLARLGGALLGHRAVGERASGEQRGAGQRASPCLRRRPLRRQEPRRAQRTRGWRARTTSRPARHARRLAFDRASHPITPEGRGFRDASAQVRRLRRPGGAQVSW